MATKYYPDDVVDSFQEKDVPLSNYVIVELSSKDGSVRGVQTMMNQMSDLIFSAYANHFADRPRRE